MREMEAGTLFCMIKCTKKNRMFSAFLLFSATLLLIVAAPCRFVLNYTTADLFANRTLRDQFLLEYAAGEVSFMKGKGLDQSTSMTYDGQPLDVTSGLPTGSPHMFSAPSKESLHVGILARVLHGDSSIANQTYTVDAARDVLALKVASYE